MISKELQKTLGSLSDGINAVIDSYGLIGDLKKGWDTDWTPNLMSIIKKEFSWTPDEEYIIDMVSELYQKVFLERIDKILSKYVPIGKKGHKAPLEGYLHKIMVRAGQEVSKKQYNYFKRYKNVTPYEDESVDDSMDRIMQHDNNNHREMSVVDHILFDQIVNDLKGVIKSRQDYEMQVKILTLLIEGFTKSEIARYLNVSAPKISQRIKKLKDDLSELATYYKHKGDSSLYKFMKKYEVASISGRRNPETSQSVLAGLVEQISLQELMFQL